MAAQPSQGMPTQQPVQSMQPLQQIQAVQGMQPLHQVQLGQPMQQHPLAMSGMPMNGMAMKVALPSASDWSVEEDKILENTLTESWDAPDRMEKAASRLPMRSLDQVRLRFRLLEEDIANIDAGRIPLPNYASAQEHTSLERRKGIPWTEEEHRLFLMGLAKFGKGDWRSISRNYVISRTPTQVASHAQKYFIRLNSLNKKDKRRSSIHDITSPGGNTGEVTGLMPQALQQGTGMPPGGVMGAVGQGAHMVPRPAIGMQTQRPPFHPQQQLLPQHVPQQQQPPPTQPTGNQQS